MIDPRTEHTLTAKEAAKEPEYQRNGRPAHLCTVVRHMLSGRLESIKVGGTRLTSREAIRRMIVRDNPTVVIPAVTPREREKQINSAERRLALSGI